MPVELERTYRRQAEAAFPGDRERQDAFVYAKLRRTGWKPKREQR